MRTSRPSMPSSRSRTNSSGGEVQITAGLRYEETEVTSTALQSVPTNILWTADNDFLIQYGNQLQDGEGQG